MSLRRPPARPGAPLTHTNCHRDGARGGHSTAPPVENVAPLQQPEVHLVTTLRWVAFDLDGPVGWPRIRLRSAWYARRNVVPCCEPRGVDIVSGR